MKQKKLTVNQLVYLIDIYPEIVSDEEATKALEAEGITVDDTYFNFVLDQLNNFYAEASNEQANNQGI